MALSRPYKNLVKGLMVQPTRSKTQVRLISIVHINGIFHNFTYFLTFNLENNEVSVIKVIDTQDSNRLADQLQEVRLMLTVKDHPHIVKCLNCFVEDASQ